MRRPLALCVLLTACAAAAAHPLQSPLTDSLGWHVDPLVGACLSISLLLYAIGAVRLLRRSGAGRQGLWRQIGFFAAGWLTLVAALISPIDAAGSVSFAMHMIQHELLMIVAAPLLVLCRPLGFWVWSLPHAWRKAIGATVQTGVIRAAWRTVTRPLNAWIVHFAALWLWHAPFLFQAALRNDNVHALQHACFLFSALLFWWAVLRELMGGPRRGMSIVYLFTTMMHTGALGALFAMSATIWYPDYGASASRFDLSPLEDQQLGGLIMWVPGGLAYVIAGLVLCAGWLLPQTRPASLERAK
ncbi:cytochrome c oxidase assembly protein [Oxalobacteraceae bacterium CAVE-383]|nr:cytochrome c oxidase assembly protein [Oxalobacteraceae bacterium CAVE-383]